MRTLGTRLRRSAENFLRRLTAFDVLCLWVLVLSVAVLRHETDRVGWAQELAKRPWLENRQLEFYGRAGGPTIRFGEPQPAEPITPVLSEAPDRGLDTGCSYHPLIGESLTGPVTFPPTPDPAEPNTLDGASCYVRGVGRVTMPPVLNRRLHPDPDETEVPDWISDAAAGTRVWSHADQMATYQVPDESALSHGSGDVYRLGTALAWRAGYVPVGFFQQAAGTLLNLVGIPAWWSGMWTAEGQPEPGIQGRPVARAYWCHHSGVSALCQHWFLDWEQDTTARADWVDAKPGAPGRLAWF